jgi:hypothetical protein
MMTRANARAVHPAICSNAPTGSCVIARLGEDGAPGNYWGEGAGRQFGPLLGDRGANSPPTQHRFRGSRPSADNVSGRIPDHTYYPV